MINDLNKKFGKLTAISLEKDKNGYNTRYLCKCDCGNLHSVCKNHLRAGSITHCGCDAYKGAKHHQWKGVGKISGNWFHSRVLRSADGSKGNRKKKEVTITIQYIWELFLKQKEKCAISGIKIYLPEGNNQEAFKASTASLDRIDSNKGYIPGNVQWVHKDVNLSKNVFSQEYFINMCKIIANNNKK